jgi:hypothetical protein
VWWTLLAWAYMPHFIIYLMYRMIIHVYYLEKYVWLFSSIF